MGRNISTDIEGIIRELNITEAEVLYPFFEAVVNSIQSIKERSSFSDGRISVYVERDKSEQVLFEEYAQYPIKSIQIIDNGIGFTQQNYESFGKSHSTKKAHLGGKGLGRFAILSVFNTVEVKSITAKDADNAISFKLSRTQGLSDPIYSTSKNDIQTTIKLSDLNPEFKTATAKYSQEDIADNILSHCLLYYLNSDVPLIEIIEDNLVINLSNQFSPKDFIKHHYTEKLGEYEFFLYFIKNDKIKSHEYCLCGHNRKVKGKKVETILPIFSSKLKEINEDSEYFIQIYAVSPYLDSIVNMSRNEFRFPKSSTETENMLLIDNASKYKITEKDIEQIIVNAIYDKYKDIIDNRKAIVKQKVTNYLSSDEGLEYRHLNPDDAFYSSIPDDVDEKKLDEILHTYQYKCSKEVRKKRDRLFSKDYSNKKDYQNLLKEVVSLTTNEGNSRLAQYVSHRKTIISLLEKYLEWSDENNNYEEESTLHNLIYTMGGNQNTIAYDKHNLWLLDDRLTFHRYIYSDKQIKSHKPIEDISACKKETDIAIYDKSFYYAEKNDYSEINSVVIFEFKRPDRNITYEEFSKQMREQILGIRDGKLTDDNKKHIQTSTKTPIFFYYVCDVNAYANLKKSAEIEGFSETPYKSLLRLSNNNVYQEILTYQTLIINAKRRNKIFFKKLGIE